MATVQLKSLQARPRPATHMPVPSRKSRMISLRLSDEAYAVLRARYSSYGARSVSDLARLAIDHVIGKAPASDIELLAKVQEMSLRLHAIEQHVAFLVARQKTIS